MLVIQNYINGEFKEPLSKNYFDSYNPATTKAYSKVPDSNYEDAKLAFEAAKKASHMWGSLSSFKRADFLRKISQEILNRLDDLALAESIDSGKPIKLCQTLDIPRSAQNFSFFADEIEKFKGDHFLTEQIAENKTTYSPLGVVSCISPWNLPLYLFTWKIAPALAAGNCVVAKPSEITPMTAFLLSKICEDVGLPSGVLNIIHGYGPQIGPEMIENSISKAISFTGSTAVGLEINQRAAKFFKKTSLELGGKNPTIVFSDCDFDLTIQMAVRSSFLNQGQICLCGSRLLIEDSIYERFKEAFIIETKKLICGDPLNLATDQGAVVSKMHFEKIMKCIEIAKSEGGKILTGGTKGPLEWSVLPTIIEGLNQNCQTNQTEIFGPVVTLQKFSTEAEAIALANSTDYGLAASLWSKDLIKAERVAQEIQAGLVWINTWMLRDLRTPFGGVKNSGLGREGGRYALEFFSQIKNICIKKDLQ